MSFVCSESLAVGGRPVVFVLETEVSSEGEGTVFKTESHHMDEALGHFLGHGAVAFHVGHLVRGKAHEVAAGELYVLKRAVLSALQERRIEALYLHVHKADVADTRGLDFRILVHSAVHREEDLVHADVGEGYVLYAGCFAAVVVGGVVRVPVRIFRQVHAHTLGGVIDDNVGEVAVTDYAVVCPCKAHGGRPAAKDAVGYGDPFAGLVLLKGAAVGTDDYGVVSAFDDAVGDGDVTGAVEVDAVVVGIAHVGQNLAAVKVNAVAVVDPIAPAGRLVAHGDVRNGDVGASGEEDHPGEGLLARNGAHKVPAFPVLALLGLGEVGAIAVYDTAASDGDVVGLVGIDEGNIPSAGHGGRIVVAYIGAFGVVGKVRGRKEDGIGLNVEVHTALDFKRGHKEGAT